MAIQPFQWSRGGEKMSPNRVKRYEDIAAALAANNQAASTFGGGLAKIGDALMYNSANSRAEAGAEQGAASRQQVIDALMGNPDPGMSDLIGAMSNEWVQADPGSSAIVQALMGREMQQSDPMYQMQLERGRLELDQLRNPVADIPDSVQALDLRAQRAGLQPGTPEYTDFMVSGGGGGQTINVGGNNDIGTIPAGMMVQRDEAGNVIGMAPIPGGPAAQEAEANARAAEANQQQSERYGNVVVEDIDRAVAAIEADPALTTGLVGQWMAGIGGTPANRVNNLLDTVKANAGFDRLQAMRDASPTGGALGAVSERELTLLNSAIGSLEQSNTAEDLTYNLKRVQRIYDEIINGPEAAAQEQQTQPTGDQPYVDGTIIENDVGQRMIMRNGNWEFI